MRGEMHREMNPVVLGDLPPLTVADLIAELYEFPMDALVYYTDRLDGPELVCTVNWVSDPINEPEGVYLNLEES